MVWNYRVLKETIDGEEKKYENYRIIEVYYDEDGVMEGWCDCDDSVLNANGIDGETYEEFKDDIEWVLKAFDYPVLIKDKNGKLYELKDNEV